MIFRLLYDNKHKKKIWIGLILFSLLLFVLSNLESCSSLDVNELTAELKNLENNN